MNNKFVSCLTCTALILLLLGGCGEKTVSENEPQNQTSSQIALSTSENKSDIAEKMPSIVFLHRLKEYDSKAKYDGYVFTDVAFYDSNGNYCKVTSSEKMQLTINKLIEEYEAGKLAGSIEIVSKCDTSELKANYKKLCGLSKNADFALNNGDKGEVVPAVEASIDTWYGIYFDSAERKEILFRQKDVAGNHTPNDERATEIYEWFLKSIRE